jgi:signal transduction histidine kinase
LLTSGAWASAHVGYLLAPTAGLQYALYVVGLVVGLAAVGPWLYFCSAYTGRSLHRNPTIRRLAVGVFAVIVAVKLTNPVHGLYFSTDVAAVPFTYLRIVHEPLHWLVMALAYSLSIVGFFMLFELFVRVNSDARPLFFLVSLTGLPVVFDVLGVLSSSVLDITYSSLGVAAFSIGVLYVYLDRFQVVRMTGGSDDPIVVLDDDGRIWDYNSRARELFPSLGDGLGEPVETALPAVDDVIDAPDPILEWDTSGVTRYYNVSSTPFSADNARTGRTIILTDITHREQYRRKLERQNEQLERFAGIVSHDLRNPLSVAEGWTELAIEEDDTDVLTNVVDAHDRMNEIIEEILALAREGTSIDEVEDVALGTVARRSWEMVSSGDASLAVEMSGDLPLEADPERLQQLFENLFRNALEHGGSGVTVTVGDLPDGTGFFVGDDGVGIPEDDREEVFTPGYTTAEHGTGFGLSIVQEIVEAHGWTIRVSESADGGARFEITTATPSALARETE